MRAEWTHALMAHFSDSLGVDSTYNSRSSSHWMQSPSPRQTAGYGIRMVRQLNRAYPTPLTDVFPTEDGGRGRPGPTDDVAESHCATCHQGAYRPLLGAPMAPDDPSLPWSDPSPQAAADHGEDGA
jgi:photosynthetic reaction center cytochrome c subunit